MAFAALWKMGLEKCGWDCSQSSISHKNHKKLLRSEQLWICVVCSQSSISNKNVQKLRVSERFWICVVKFARQKVHERLQRELDLTRTSLYRGFPRRPTAALMVTACDLFCVWHTARLHIPSPLGVSPVGYPVFRAGAVAAALQICTANAAIFALPIASAILSIPFGGPPFLHPFAQRPWKSKSCRGDMNAMHAWSMIEP